ncbi:MAG: 30S ribosomal protein S17 [Candidatus Brocadia sp.]|nr:MAG: 30S ribosomal protein S17 [Candidatus Brocadia sp.]
MDTDNVRGRRRKVVGMVIGDKMQKTIVVEVTRMIRHSRYGKYIKRSIIYKKAQKNITNLKVLLAILR